LATVEFHGCSNLREENRLSPIIVGVVRALAPGLPWQLQRTILEEVDYSYFAPAGNSYFLYKKYTLYKAYFLYKTFF
jgi:hypothetical protein